MKRLIDAIMDDTTLFGWASIVTCTLIAGATLIILRLLGTL